MGWRISLYRVSKETHDKYKNITQEDYDACIDEVFDELQKERIAYDVLTDLLVEDREGKMSSKYFTNRLNIEEDMYFGTISKEQMLNIIENVRLLNYKWFNDRRVVLKKDEEPELGELWTDPERYYLGTVTSEEALKKNQSEWNHKASKWGTVWKDNERKSYPDINIDLNNKWLISGSWTYEYFIFDLIHIYKIFDWENDVLLCIGG